MKTLTENLEVVLRAKTIKGTSFVGMENYLSQANELSNQTLVAGISLERLLQNDFKALQENKDKMIAEVTEKYGETIALKAYENVYNSLDKRLSSEEVKEVLRLENDATIRRSDAQIDAFTQIAKGIKIHKETQKLHVFGLVVSKKVLVKGEYKSVNSKDLTLAQNMFKKDFRQNKYRTFILDNGLVNIQGAKL